MSRRIAIMQPTFLPWLGYFGLIARVDTFVLLDDVQFARRSWQQRNRIKTPQGAQWITVPAESRGKRNQRILDVRIDDSGSFGERTLRTLDLSYARAPFYDTTRELVAGPIAAVPERLVDLTIPLIARLCRAFGIATPLRRSSELAVEGKREHLLIAICKALGGTTYVSPPGSHVYLDGSTAFPDAGLVLEYHQYDHPTYPQLWGEFVPYLSAVDLLFNVGPDAGAVIRSGIRS